MIRISGKSRHIALVLALLGFAPAAFAYLDPSTGSMILSAIIGIFATLSLAVKTYWYKLKSLFGGKQERRSEPARPDQDAVPDSDDTQR